MKINRSTNALTIVV